jgi:hypothetical protein
VFCRCLLVRIPFAYAQGYSTTVPPGAKLSDPDCYTAVTTTLTPQDLSAAIHINSATDVVSLRATLITQIWGTNALPVATVNATTTPGASIVATRPPAGSDSGNLSTNASGMYAYLAASSDTQPSFLGTEYRLTWPLLASPQINSIIYAWTPKFSNGRLFIVHDGHSPDDYDVNTGKTTGKAIADLSNVVTVSRLLQAGYTVIWIQMPLFGDNLTSLNASFSTVFPDTPVGNCTTSPYIQVILTQSGNTCLPHDLIFANTRTWGNPFRYFIEPVIVAINTALTPGNLLSQNGPFVDITMMGASGGGWTSVVAAALDRRITNSASVAGSLPLFYPSASDPPTCTFSRDAEQITTTGALYNSVSYLDLYIMAANGTDPTGRYRRHMQINNQFDSCCFYGINFLGYVPTLSNHIQQNNLGNYRYILDTTFVGHAYDLGSLNGVVVNNNTLSTVQQMPAINAVVSTMLR